MLGSTMPKLIVPSMSFFFNKNKFFHEKRASGAHAELRNFWQPKRTMLDIAAEAEEEEEEEEDEDEEEEGEEEEEAEIKKKKEQKPKKRSKRRRKEGGAPKFYISKLSINRPWRLYWYVFI